LRNVLNNKTGSGELYYFKILYQKYYNCCKNSFALELKLIRVCFIRDDDAQIKQYYFVRNLKNQLIYKEFGGL